MLGGFNSSSDDRAFVPSKSLNLAQSSPAAKVVGDELKKAIKTRIQTRGIVSTSEMMDSSTMMMDSSTMMMDSSSTMMMDSTSTSTSSMSYSTPSYGSGGMSWGSDGLTKGYDGCVQQCIASFGAPGSYQATAKVFQAYDY
ncbi:hypothetical protein D9757_012508 [Collybiopsis confluens]|uniref:Uncharacterized protein n=1 Tax=Collybiopsis confluens TaxID=2823264 RepID=A0A8H5D260_9AGAR|nr:hypothetical protein D9757_012508 [Collybiopsis confluens]